MRRALVVLTMVLAVGAAANGGETTTGGNVNSDPGEVARLLSGLDLWILPQPKSAAATGGEFDLARCQGIRLAGEAGKREELTRDFPALLRERSGVSLARMARTSAEGCITLGLFPHGASSAGLPAGAAAELDRLPPQGYVLHIDSSGVTAAATEPAGLYYAAQTIAQIAADRTVLPGVHIRDWPSLAYRGAMYDISRGQMPTVDTLQRLAAVLSEGKANMLELYLEDMFHWRRHGDIAPAEAMTPQEARSLFDAAARRHVEVHPMLQVLGHFDKIGGKAAYRHLMVPVPPGGIAGHAWTTTVDVRKPEAVAFVSDLVGEICDAFPGKFLNVDITEIADYGFICSGTKAEKLPELMIQYVGKLRDLLAKRGMRLLVAQCALDSTGHLNGVGRALGKLPRDVVVASYYTAEFYGNWQKDFSRLKERGIGLFAQPWIDSHGHIMPYVGHAMDFSDITVARALPYGAMGSVTTDWGDDGHYHLPAVTWYPFLYHSASAWTGARLDRDYFNRAFSRLLFGVKDDGLARAILLAGNINAQPVKIRNSAGGVDQPPYVGNSRFGCYYYEFFADPFADRKITEIVDPGKKGRDILAPADEAARLLAVAGKTVRRNHDAVEQLRFAAANYQAMARKLIIREHYLDPRVPRSQVAAELTGLVKTYQQLRQEFSRLWLASCKDAGSFRDYLRRYDQTIIPCRKKAGELQGN
jgi:uncharacterized protein YegJ (DUF2314 family)